jgi:hypothetical protein
MKVVSGHYKREQMRIVLTIILLMFLQLCSFSQETFTSRKGSKFFPGHLDILINLDSKSVRYELFNHWYTSSYAELRQITIPLDSLNEFNKQNDTIKIEIHNGEVKLVDKKYGLTRKVKHKNLCAPASTMRNISFAYKLSSQEKNMRHFELYEREDLKLDEETFKKKVIGNLAKKK